MEQPASADEVASSSDSLRGVAEAIGAGDNSHDVLPDSGARWRIKVSGSGRYLYTSGDELVGAPYFFSLYELRRSKNGAYMFADHAGKWLHLKAPEQAGERRRLAPLQGSFSQGFSVPGEAEAEQKSPPRPAQFWLQTLPSGLHALRLAADGGGHLCEDLANPRQLVAVEQPAAAVNASGAFELQPVIAELAQRRRSKLGSFERRLQRATIQVGGRDLVFVTYHNVGMLDWAVLFWGWLRASGIPSFFLLELDGLTCDAASAINPSLTFECATVEDMLLPTKLTQMRRAGALQEWGTDADSGYFKFLRWKLRFTELSLLRGVDVLMADVDVLVLSPNFLVELTKFDEDLVISSDARKGSYDDQVHCPMSQPMYQHYSHDWVCAGLYYIRATHAGKWFMREVQMLMDEFTITDQDAMQAVLTGHTQVAVPQATQRENATHSKLVQEAQEAREAEASGGARKSRAKSSNRPSELWLKPLWLEGLGSHENLRNTKGIQPLLTPMREEMWRSYQRRQRAKGFTWTNMPLERFGNGPVLWDHWRALFSRPDGIAAKEGGAGRAGPFLSIHANCNTKHLLVDDDRGISFLLHPVASSDRL